MMLLAPLVLILVSRVVHADTAGDAVLAQMDATMNRYRTLRIEYGIVNKERPDGDERTAAVTVLLKGQKRYTEFTGGDMKGTKILVLSPTEMYVYLPSFGKVRRIVSNTKDQGFLGLAFQPDAVALPSYSAQYTAAIASEDARAWRLTLIPKPGQNPDYAKIEVTVDKEKKLPTELKYLSAEGKNIKTDVRSGYSCEGGLCTPGELKMTDNIKGAWTKLVERSRKVNLEISDDVFTVRKLGE
jgi:outer membrane lipoprotein-sorting protein